MAGNFPNLKKETYPGTGCRVQNKRNPNRSTLGHIIIKIAKVSARFPRQQEKNKVSVKRQSPRDHQLIFLQKCCRPKGSGKIYSKF